MINTTVIINVVTFMIIFGFSFLIGLALLRRTKSTSPFTVAVSPATGMLALAVQLYFYGFFNIPWNIFTIIAPWLVYIIIIFDSYKLVVKKTIIGLIKRSKALLIDSSLLEKVVVLLILYCALVIFILVITHPVVGGDAIAMWLYKAKAYYAQGMVNIDFFKSDLARHVDYPPLLSLVYSVFFTFSGKMNGTLANSSILILMISAASGLFYVLKQACGKQRALLLLLLFISLPLFFPYLVEGRYLGFADLYIGLLFLLTILSLYVGFTRKNIDNIVLGLIFATSSALVKNEGTLVLGATILIVIINARIITNPIRSFLKNKYSIYLMLLFVLLVAWNVQIKTKGISSEFTSLEVLKRISYERTKYVMSLVLTHFKANPAIYQPFVALLITLPFLIIKRSRLLSSMYFCILLLVAGYACSYIMSPYDLSWHITFSIDRLVIHIVPAIFFLFSILVFENFSSVNKQKHPSK